MVCLSVPGAPVLVSQKRLASWAFHMRQCLWFTKKVAPNKKHPVSGSPVGENSSLMRGQKRIVQANRRATNRQITASRKAQLVSPCHGWAIVAEDHTGSYLPAAKHKKKRLQWACGHQQLTIEEWKNIAWSDESKFLLRHADGRVRIWHKQHESMAPSLPGVYGSGCWWCNGVENVFLAHVRSLDIN